MRARLHAGSNLDRLPAQDAKQQSRPHSSLPAGVSDRRTARGLRIAILVAAVALPLFAASPAQALRSEFYGIVQGPANAQDRVGMKTLKIRTDRIIMNWRDIETRKGVRDWTETDAEYGALAAQGIRVLPFVWGSPEWTNNGAGTLARPPTSSADQTAWRDFLRAAVGRYGPGGFYWTSKFPQQHPGVPPLPVTAWQIWNEPNLRKYFAPGATVQASAQKYVTLLQVSRTAIRSIDPAAKIVLAGMPIAGDSTADGFLQNIYNIAGSKNYFEVAALHPYACNVLGVKNGITKFRGTMNRNADSGAELWFTEFAWGSGPPDQFCKNKGEAGQRDLLNQSYLLFLQNRTAWNLQRVYWFLFRDPPAGSDYARLCSICGTAGLLRNNRTTKPAYATFRNFTTETTRPVVTITGGPAAGGTISDTTPTFTFSSNEPGSTFMCRYDSNPFGNCKSPNTKATPLTAGSHTFAVKAVDAPGNESTVKTRTFTVSP
jgi:hypothetical protein